jgi:hypothetical protein
MIRIEHEAPVSFTVGAAFHRRAERSTRLEVLHGGEKNPVEAMLRLLSRQGAWATVERGRGHSRKDQTRLILFGRFGLLRLELAQLTDSLAFIGLRPDRRPDSLDGMVHVTIQAPRLVPEGRDGFGARALIRAIEEASVEHERVVARGPAGSGSPHGDTRRARSLADLGSDANELLQVLDACIEFERAVEEQTYLQATVKSYAYTDYRVRSTSDELARVVFLGKGAPLLRGARVRVPGLGKQTAEVVSGSGRGVEVLIPGGLWTRPEQKGDLVVVFDDVATKARREAIQAWNWTNPALLQALLSPDSLGVAPPFLPDDSLDDQYKAAAMGRMQSSADVVAVQGPPGAGKTYLIQSFIVRTLEANPDARILVTSYCHAAVDNALDGLDARGVRVLRHGRPGKAETTHLSTSVQARLRDEIVSRLPPAGAGDSPEHQRFLTDWREALGEDGPDSTLEQIVMLRSQVHGVTCVGSWTIPALRRMRFDVVIVDEAGQIPLPDLLIPIRNAQRAILVGDHEQLRPIVSTALEDALRDPGDLPLTPEVRREIFALSGFELIWDRLPADRKESLWWQYRMPESLSRLPSDLFYNGDLTAAPSSKAQAFESGILEAPIVWVDAGRAAHELRTYQEDGSRHLAQSVVNRVEAAIIGRFLEQEVIAGIDSIGVIAMYRAQADLLQDYLGERPNLTVDTVDGFQGRQRDLIIVSFCASLPGQKAIRGFIRDPHRLCVALSRQRRGLVLVGDRGSLSRIRGDRRFPNAQKQFARILATGPGSHAVIRTPLGADLQSLEILRKGWRRPRALAGPEGVRRR